VKTFAESLAGEAAEMLVKPKRDPAKNGMIQGEIA